MINYQFKQTALLASIAVAISGCASTRSGMETQNQDKESSNTSLVAQTDCSDYELDSLESAKLLELQSEIKTILSERNIGNSNTTETSTSNQVAKIPGQNLVGLEDTPSPNKEMARELDQIGVFDNFGKDFQLLKPITRGEYLTLLYYANNAIRLPKNHLRLAPAHDPGFTDIDSQHPAYKYVQAFSHSGYSVGYPDNTFKPDQPITREEMIGIKAPLDAGTPDSSGHNIWDFNDFDQIDPKFVRFIFADHFLKKSGKGSNIQRAFGSIKSFKPKESVFGYEAIGSVWQFGGKGIPAETAIDVKERS